MMLKPDLPMTLQLPMNAEDLTVVLKQLDTNFGRFAPLASMKLNRLRKQL